VARRNPEMGQAFDAWMNPRPSPGLAEQERELRRVQREGQGRRAEIDQGWIDFVNRMRADPAQLRQLQPPTERGVDGRLFDLWQLLRSASRGHARYAIYNVAALEPVVGAEVASAVRDGLVAHWRQWSPIRKSERAIDQLNSIRSLDVMGLVGVSF